MDFFKKEKLLFYAVLVLIGLNMATLIVIWVLWGKGPPPRPREFDPDFHKKGDFSHFRGKPHARGELFDAISEKLGLNPHQKEEFEKLGKEHFSKVDELIRDIERAKKELFDMLFLQDIDQAKVAEKINAIGEKKSKIEELTFKHFQSIISLCNEEQKNKLKDIFRHVFQPSPGDFLPPGNEQINPHAQPPPPFPPPAILPPPPAYPQPPVFHSPPPHIPPPAQP